MTRDIGRKQGFGRRMTSVCCAFELLERLSLASTQARWTNRRSSREWILHDWRDGASSRRMHSQQMVVDN